MHKGQRHRDSAFAHTDATVRHAFIQLMQLQNEQRQELMAKGAVCQEMPASITTSMPCGRYTPLPQAVYAIREDYHGSLSSRDSVHFRNWVASRCMCPNCMIFVGISSYPAADINGLWHMSVANGESCCWTIMSHSVTQCHGDACILRASNQDSIAACIDLLKAAQG